MDVNLSPEERDLLIEVLESRVKELHPEIRRSMDHNYKDMLNRKLECCQGLIERLKGGGDAE